MELNPDREQQIVARILKVNHAGEHGAIWIYGAQIAIARKFHPEIVDQLRELRNHEIEHHRLFSEAMAKRSARPCRMLFLWSWGGAVLGFVTALLGKRMVWICTEAVEEAVHHHLSDQLHFLKQRDLDLFAIISAIQTEEQGHLDLARQNRGEKGIVSRTALVSIAYVTDMLIWMSTSGDSVKLKSELAKNRPHT